MTLAKIYRPTKNAMQSGKATMQQWLLVYEPEQPRSHDAIMGWVSSTDMKQEIKMRFVSKEKAIEYAERNNIPYRVIDPQQPKIIIKSYADNFKAS